MIPRFGMATVVGLLFGAAAATAVVTYKGGANLPQAPSAQGVTTGAATIGGPFQLINTLGAPVSSTDFAGKHLLVYFGFTNCPDICPAGLQQISAALDKLGSDSKNLVPLFISVDPERDTPEKLGVYMSSFHKDIVGLTGSVEAVSAAAKAYKVYFKKVETGSTPGDYSIDHSGFMYLMAPDSRFLQHFRHNVDATELAVKISSAIKPAP